MKIIKRFFWLIVFILGATFWIFTVGWSLLILGGEKTNNYIIDPVASFVYRKLK